MHYFVITKQDILHLFNDHKGMSAGDIVMEVVFWNSNVFKNNPVETRNQKLTLLTVKSKYDTLMKMSNEPKKDDELKKSSKKFKTSSSWGKEK